VGGFGRPCRQKGCGPSSYMVCYKYRTQGWAGPGSVGTTTWAARFDPGRRRRPCRGSHKSPEVSRAVGVIRPGDSTHCPRNAIKVDRDGRAFPSQSMCREEEQKPRTDATYRHILKYVLTRSAERRGGGGATAGGCELHHDKPRTPGQAQPGYCGSR